MKLLKTIFYDFPLALMVLGFWVQVAVLASGYAS